MEITSSQVSMMSATQQMKHTEKSTKKESWVNPSSNNSSNDSNVNLNLSQLSKMSPVGSSSGMSADDLKLKLIEALLEAITGKKVKLGKADAQSIQKALCDVRSGNANSEQSSSTRTSSGMNGVSGMGMSIEYNEKYEESQSMVFGASALIKTADGKEIAVDLSLSMSRSFVKETNLKMTFGAEKQMQDPLVVNFDGNADAISQSTFKFDLTADGKQENISTLNDGSGFLVLDKNGNGKIDDGSEMFGAKSGNGFVDLAKYDNGNGWIDSGDSIYNQLKIWSPDENGNGKLIALADVGVDAIYLKPISTDFTFKDFSNNILGQNKQTSIFVGENGNSGIMQQIDLAVS